MRLSMSAWSTRGLMAFDALPMACRSLRIVSLSAWSVHVTNRWAMADSSSDHQTVVPSGSRNCTAAVSSADLWSINSWLSSRNLSPAASDGTDLVCLFPTRSHHAT